jgi:hypothetical protein
MDTKYAVMVEGKSSPSKFHDDYDSAVAEATRLAQMERRTVYVLKPVAVVELNDVKITTL